MVKTDMSRDYYADLELPALSDIAEVKRQFRKLALKYHPDRNPGKETEVNVKFQIIQSANEILSNVEEKAKYDAKYSRAKPAYRYPAASGVRGNPWQNVSEQFPAPPTRNPPGSARSNPSAGAQRYTNLAHGVPPSSNRVPSREDQESRYAGWSRMRPPSTSKATHAASPSTGSAPTAKAEAKQTRPVPPRPQTGAQKQKAEASFGNRRSGPVPRSPMAEDPAVDGKTYFNQNPRTNLFGEVRTAKRPVSAYSTYLETPGFIDGRQSTPYQTHGGEKTNPFDGINNPSRTNSTRAQDRGGAHDSSGPDGRRARHRSSSVPDESANIKEANTRESAPRADQQPPKFSFATSRAEQRYKPKGDGDARRTSFPNSSSSELENNEGPTNTNGGAGSSKRDRPPLYAHPTLSFTSPWNFRHPNSPYTGPAHLNLPADGVGLPGENSPSGERRRSRISGLNVLETKQYHMLSNLMRSTANPENGSQQQEQQKQDGSFISQSKSESNKNTDNWRPSSFSFPAQDDSSSKPTEKQPFTRTSTDDINTRFVAEERPMGWAFNAGGGSSSDDPPSAGTKARSKSSSRLGGSSPTKHRSLKQARSTETARKVEVNHQPTSGFAAEEWSQKIGPHDFVPQPSQGVSVSPTRGARAMKKKPIWKTMGTAGMVDEETSSSDEVPKSGSATAEVAGSSHPGTASPNAMDIDTEPPEPSASTVNGARNIPVEPSRPEWRPGNVDELGGQIRASSASATTTFAVPTAGSEDSEDFLKANLGDLKNVEPFAPAAPSGLGSFADLKSTLPFESRASAKFPLPRSKPKNQEPLDLPRPPKAPHAPAPFAIANLKPSQGVWDEYARQFHKYMQEFAAFSAWFADHFALRTRQAGLQAKSGFAWLDSRGDGGIEQYLFGLEQDREARRQWAVACEEHGLRLKEFMIFRDKMKQ